MTLTVKPAAVLKGAIQLPASKSYSIRAILAAACGGNSTVFSPSLCDDAMMAVRVAKALGSEIIQRKETSALAWIIRAGKHRRKISKINVGESGTVLRFVLPLLALQGKKITVNGDGTLRGRPNLFLTEALRQMGVDIRGTGKNESVPVRLKGGVLRGGNTVIDGSLSSQFISSLLIACPQLHEDTCLTLEGESVVSADYITMTCQILEKCGVKIRRRGLRKYIIKGKQKFVGLKDFMVPSDYGLAAFPIAAALLSKSDITLNGHLENDMVQADGHILPLLKRMGAQFQKTSKYIRIKGPCVLKGGNFSLSDCPDLVPVMSVIALFAKGRTRLYNIGHVRSKESDRISDLRKELLKIGANITEERDALVINPQPTYRSDCLLDPHHDHRLAMSFCVLGTKLAVRVKDIECTRKSYPQFVKDFKMIGVPVRNG